MKTKETTRSLAITKVYDLAPTNGRKSFCKAKVLVLNNGSDVLQSYNTNIIEKRKDGTFIRLCDPEKLSMTTCIHTKSFCGLTKKQVVSLPAC